MAVADASDAPPSYSPQEQPASPKTGPKSFFSNLSKSFEAMTANLRPKPEPYVSPLCAASVVGDASQIKGFLDLGANINGRNEDGKTALICAIDSLSIPTARLLFDLGASLSATDSKGVPPLYRAAATNDLAMVKLLLGLGADPNDRANTGKAHFADAALKCDISVVR